MRIAKPRSVSCGYQSGLQWLTAKHTLGDTAARVPPTLILRGADVGMADRAGVFSLTAFDGARWRGAADRSIL